jgi:microcystin-dependent protein
MNQNAYLGEIAQFAGLSPNDNNWLPCDGRLLPINSNQALYAYIGNKFGGDGVNNFGLPNLNGRIPINEGTGTGLSPRTFATNGGNESITMTTDQLPQHTHHVYNIAGGNIMASSSNGTQPNPDAVNNTIAAAFDPTFQGQTNNVYNNMTPDTAWTTGSNPTTVSNTGAGQPFSVMQSYLTIGYYICIKGQLPVRP